MISESLRASCHLYSKELEVSGGNMYNLSGLCGRDAITVPTLSKVLHSCDIHERGSPTIRLVSLATKTHFPCTESQCQAAHNTHSLMRILIHNGNFSQPKRSSFLSKWPIFSCLMTRQKLNQDWCWPCDHVCRCDSRLESTSLKGKEAVIVSQSHSVMSGVTILAWFVLSTVTIYTTQEKI